MVKNLAVRKDTDASMEGEFESPVNDLLEESLFLPDADMYEEDNTLNVQAINKYKNYMENTVIFKVDIKKSDNVGNLSVPLSGNLTGIIKNAEVYGNQYDARKRNLHVGVTYAVIVTEIDEVNGIVYLSRHKAKLRAKEVLAKTLKPGTKVKARVEFYQEKNKRVYLNIEGCGILGYVHISEWSHKFIEDKDIEKEVKPKEVIKVEILSFKPRKGKIQEIFECSRKKCVSNPWLGIENKIKKNDIFEIVASDLHKEMFYGPLPDMDLDVYCEYPCKSNSLDEEKKAAENSTEYSEAARYKNNTIIKKGHKYQIRVYKVNEERQILRARVIKEITEER